ncbi:phage protein Gp27 family protein [uncultured Clostridium sp.]|uniref:phage protein Gp27 family protein n=1 Tax=uncultured Clostridium sp. TaxID=59620 RepID=UPI0025F9C6B2|nr:phage protein Gp27 family protein [uncultured Clostridium sp.]
MDGKSKNRKRRKYAVEKLDPEIKEKVDGMIRNNSTYNDIVEYIKSTGNSVSKSAIQRYASNLIQTLQTLRIINENFRAITEETEIYNNIDFGEPLLRILSNQLLGNMGQLPESQSMDINEITRNAVALTRAIAYKKKIDLQNKSTLENGLEQFESMIFEALKDEKPQLYRELKKYLDEKFRGIQNEETNPNK